MRFFQITLLLTLSFHFLLLTNAHSQAVESKFSELTPRQNVYVELGGNGIAFNVMYERRLQKQSDGVGIKAGIGGFSGSYEKVFTVPVGVNWLLTKDNKHFFEAGVGATFLHYQDSYDYWCPGGNCNPFPVDVIGLSIENKNSLYGHLTLGYRRQPKNGGITWGAALTPHFNQNGFWPVWLGFKFGYSFARK
ncbi:MAG: hypothetical protein ACKO41_02415 [Sphingomonadales bacterium]